jgi:molybdate transport system permease protein
MIPSAQADWQIVLLTLKVAVLAVLLASGPAFLAALLLRKPSRLRPIVAAFISLPLVLPPVVTGWALLLLLAGGSAVANPVVTTHLAWLLPLGTARAALVCAVMVVPLMTRGIRLGLAAVEPAVLAAAASLGAGPTDRFFAVSLPLAMPGLALALITGFTAAAGQFGAVIVAAGSIPGATQTLPLAIYAALQTPDGAATAARLALAAGAIAIAGALTAEALTRRMRIAA